MIKTIVTMIVTAIAGLIGYLVSDSFRERLAQRQRDKIASEVARGDEAAVNARIGLSALCLHIRWRSSNWCRISLWLGGERL